jgi:hypothetical protein
VLGSTVLVFGQMNEPPGARFRVRHKALTMAEHSRDDTRQDVLPSRESVCQDSLDRVPQLPDHPGRADLDRPGLPPAGQVQDRPDPGGQQSDGQCVTGHDRPPTTAA